MSPTPKVRNEYDRLMNIDVKTNDTRGGY